MRGEVPLCLRLSLCGMNCGDKTSSLLLSFIRNGSFHVGLAHLYRAQRGSGVAGSIFQVVSLQGHYEEEPSFIMGYPCPPMVTGGNLGRLCLFPHCSELFLNVGSSVLRKS